MFFMNPDTQRELLRHTLATLAYRASKCLRGVPEEMATFRASETARTPSEILAHMGDLFDWAVSMAVGKQAWHNSAPLPWEQEVERFFSTLGRFEDVLASDAPIHTSPEGLFQGPVADALMHLGQIAILRRIAGSPIRGENYFRAQIVSGRVGADQPAPVLEFD
jgi:hypothetical protein